jgi:biotin carboxyl carrier protein
MATVIGNIGDKQFKWSFEEDDSILFEGKRYRSDIQKISSGRYSLLLNGKSFDAIITRNNFTYSIIINCKHYKVAIETATKKVIGFRTSTAQKKFSDEVRSPMPGMVVRCEVKEGETISAGDGLLILEAMKMENEIRATKNGTVKRMFVRDRQVVDKGELLLIIE